MGVDPFTGTCGDVTVFSKETEVALINWLIMEDSSVKLIYENNV